MQLHNNLDVLEEIRAIAQLGLNYASDVYDRERYERLLAIACGEYASLSGLAPDKISGRFRSELGYITPKVGVSAAIFNPDGEILLVNRTDDRSWCLPCGWAEVRETPQQSVAREVLEETGFVIEVRDLIRIGTRMPASSNTSSCSFRICPLTVCGARGWSSRSRSKLRWRGNAIVSIAHHDLRCKSLLCDSHNKDLQ